MQVRRLLERQRQQWPACSINVARCSLRCARVRNHRSSVSVFCESASRIPDSGAGHPFYAFSGSILVDSLSLYILLRSTPSGCLPSNPQENEAAISFFEESEGSPGHGERRASKGSTRQPRFCLMRVAIIAKRNLPQHIAPVDVAHACIAVRGLQHRTSDRCRKSLGYHTVGRPLLLNKIDRGKRGAVPGNARRVNALKLDLHSVMPPVFLQGSSIFLVLGPRIHPCTSKTCIKKAP